MNKDDILFIPGWMDKGKNRGFPNSLDMWTEKMDLNIRFKEKVIVGHSAGIQLALLNWSKNRKSKLIIYGPMLPQRSFFGWFYKWIRFALQEGPLSKERLKFFSRPVLGLVVLFKILKINTLEMIREIPKDKIIIVKGEYDNHFCDRRIIDKIKKEGFRVVELKGVGHNWNEKIDEFICNYLYEKN